MMDGTLHETVGGIVERVFMGESCETGIGSCGIRFQMAAKFAAAHTPFAASDNTGRNTSKITRFADFAAIRP
jgi:hypothetical protein